MIKIINAKIVANDDESLDELVSVTEERMGEYARKHPDFTCVIEKHIDEDYIIVRTLKLEESAN